MMRNAQKCISTERRSVMLVRSGGRYPILLLEISMVSGFHSEWTTTTEQELKRLFFGLGLGL